MRRVLPLVVIVLVSTGVSEPSRQDTIAWIRDHAVEVRVDGPPSGPDVEAIGRMSAGARVIAFGESTHGTHEWLAIRNRILEYLVEHGGITAVAVETGFREALPIDAYLGSGTNTEPGDDIVRAMMSWSDDGTGRGRTENRELLTWIRAYNRVHGPRRIHFYGFDLSGRSAGGGFPNAAATVSAALDYVARVDHELASEFVRRFQPLLGSFRAASYARKEYDAMSGEERKALTSAIDDLNAEFERHAIRWRQSTSSAEYETAAHMAFAARQLDGYFRADFGHRGMIPDARVDRDRAMAENLAWIARQEGASGRIFAFAHDMHVQKGSGNSMGSFFDAMHTAPAFTIGTADAIRKSGNTLLPTPPQDADGLGTIFAAVGRPAFIVDLRKLPATGPVHDWFLQPHSVNPVSIVQKDPVSIRPREWYDALIFVREINIPNE